jgi:hypothetical protein
MRRHMDRWFAMTSRLRTVEDAVGKTRRERARSTTLVAVVGRLGSLSAKLSTSWSVIHAADASDGMNPAGRFGWCLLCADLQVYS